MIRKVVLALTALVAVSVSCVQASASPVTPNPAFVVPESQRTALIASSIAPSSAPSTAPTQAAAQSDSAAVEPTQSLPLMQVSTKPMIFPVALLAGPSSWLMGQPYGNSVGAYANGRAWYNAGQRLHFGIDVSMPCGTPLVAVADGEVAHVDATAFGSGPHNLIINHPQLNLVTLYGHLLERPSLVVGQTVRQGDFVALSGDPDVTCDSRPHLHLEVRSPDYRTAYNPIPYIEAPWHMLSTIGSFQNTYQFQQDLYNTRRWMSLDAQPDVAFGGRALNDYAATFPPLRQNRPGTHAVPYRDLGTLPESEWAMRAVAVGGCCPNPWWDARDPDVFYAIDGIEGQLAGIWQWDLASGGSPVRVADAPPSFLSATGAHQIIPNGYNTVIRRLSDGVQWEVTTRESLPSFSADDSQLLWEIRYGDTTPGTPPGRMEIWVSNLDGSNARMILFQNGGSAQWLDETRILLVTPNRTVSTLSVFDTRDGSQFELGSWDRIRAISVAPGGGSVMYYQVFQTDTSRNGIYVLETQQGAQPQKLDWFGGWRWRDANSVYYIPFDPTTDAQMLAYYHIPSGENRILTDVPFTVANGDWQVSADGRRILFQNANDARSTWVWEMR